MTSYDTCIERIILHKNIKLCYKHQNTIEYSLNNSLSKWWLLKCRINWHLKNPLTTYSPSNSRLMVLCIIHTYWTLIHLTQCNLRSVDLQLVGPITLSNCKFNRRQSICVDWGENSKHVMILIWWKARDEDKKTFIDIHIYYIQIAKKSWNVKFVM